jgi:hypothetical protein
VTTFRVSAVASEVEKRDKFRQDRSHHSRFRHLVLEQPGSHTRIRRATRISCWTHLESRSIENRRVAPPLQPLAISPLSRPALSSPDGSSPFTPPRSSPRRYRVLLSRFDLFGTFTRRIGPPRQRETTSWRTFSLGSGGRCRDRTPRQTRLDPIS